MRRRATIEGGHSVESNQTFDLASCVSHNIARGITQTQIMVLGPPCPSARPLLLMCLAASFACDWRRCRAALSIRCSHNGCEVCRVPRPDQSPASTAGPASPQTRSNISNSSRRRECYRSDPNRPNTYNITSKLQTNNRHIQLVQIVVLDTIITIYVRQADVGLFSLTSHQHGRVQENCS